MELTRRQMGAAAVGIAGIGTLAGCVGTASEGVDSGERGPTAQASFFVFGDITSRIGGDATDTDLLVPVGQHGHGWEPGPRIREAIRDAAVLVHGMTGFQPWVDDIVSDLAADGVDVATVDASAGVDLLATADEHTEADDHDETGDHDEDDSTDDHDAPTNADPHFWMDPLRVRDASETVRAALSDVDSAAADAHADNAREFRADLTDLHERVESLVADADEDVLLVAGHNSFRYLSDRYGLAVETLTGLAPDDRATARDIERAQAVIEDNDLRYVCADPLESQRAADQLVAETGAEAVLPLTAMPGLTDEWAENDWGYLDVMEHVNLPTLERALNR